MQNSGLYHVIKCPPHSKRGGHFFMFGQNLNLMAWLCKTALFYVKFLVSRRLCCILRFPFQSDIIILQSFYPGAAAHRIIYSAKTVSRREGGNTVSKSRLRSHSAFLYALLAVIAAAVLRQGGFRTQDPLGWLCAFLRSVIYIGLFTAWGISVRRRIIQSQVRRYLTAISVLMVF